MEVLQTLQITWFALWGLLWAVYFMLDGFVLGTGMLHNFLAKNEKEKQAMVAIVGPVWNGNEVWLITAGGATFAAFPTTYALMFSYLYTALLLLLFALIIRGVSLEFRGKVANSGWKRLWDAGILLGGFLPALLLGVAFGNIFKGLPMDVSGYHGNLFSLLNPYGLLTGVLFVMLFVVHGAIYTSVKTSGDLSGRASAFAGQRMGSAPDRCRAVPCLYGLCHRALPELSEQPSPLRCPPHSSGRAHPYQGLSD